MAQEKLDSPFWEKVGNNQYKHPSTSSVENGDSFHGCTIPFPQDTVRNAHINFKIEVLEPSKDFHAAVLFRKNGHKYLGAGLGGWGSNFSVFQRTYNSFVWFPIGSAGSISQKTYAFDLEFHGGFITAFKVNEKEQLLFPENFSIHDSLGSTLKKGAIGVYAYDGSQTKITVNVTAKPTRCFIITNIDDGETDKRRKAIESIIRGQIGDADLGETLTFQDSRDLTRENSLMPKIKSTLMESDFVIADFGFGKPRPNVFYETGIAHSIGVPVIHIGPSKELFKNPEYVPSDLKAQFFILEEELSTKLRPTVKKIIDLNSGEFNYLGT